MAEIVRQQFLVDGVDLHLKVAINKVEKCEQGISVELYGEGNHPQVTHVEGSHLLVATGRRANLDNLGLDKAAVSVNKQAKLIVDSRLRTSNKHIFACGDVVGPHLYTHMAEHQAGVVLRNALFHWPAKAQTTAIPWCTFTSPEIARVGLSEDEAEQKNIHYQVYCFPFSEIDRAITDGQTAGMAKIITNPRGKLLGACIVGPHAGELIAEYSLAITQGLKVSALSKTIHVYPTLSQINRRVADERMKSSLTPNRKRWIKRLFGLRG
jgi:pyruvate/2-oxoglutarate dehydrogenase complex dihydrolipoamide dehydrogenase (E3) component